MTFAVASLALFVAIYAALVSSKAVRDLEARVSDLERSVWPLGK